MLAAPEFKGIKREGAGHRAGRRRGTVFLPFHFAGWWQWQSTCTTYYPAGAAPMVRGEAVNTATTYGYDSVTMMQETKTTLCQIERADLRRTDRHGKNEVHL